MERQGHLAWCSRLLRLWHHWEKSLELNTSFYFFNIKMHSEFSATKCYLECLSHGYFSFSSTDKDSEMVKVERSGLLMFHRPSKNRLKTHIWKKAMGAPETPRGQVGSDSSSDAHRKKSIKVCYISSKGWHKTVCHLLSRTQKLSVWRGDIMRCQLHFLELLFRLLLSNTHSSPKRL